MAWCQFRAAEGDLAGAWGWLRWALARDPSHAEAVNMHGILLHRDGSFAEAVQIFEQAEALGNSAAASNRGNSLLDMGRMGQALRAHETAVERAPESAGALYNLALTRLRLGDWERGWVDYEARWHFREVHRAPRKFDQPRWRGEPLRMAAAFCSTPSRDWATRSSSAAIWHWWPRAVAADLEVQEPVARLMASLPPVRAGLARDCPDGQAAAGVRYRVPAP